MATASRGACTTGGVYPDQRPARGATAKHAGFVLPPVPLSARGLDEAKTATGRSGLWLN